jgi:hypothetical protein
MVKPINPDLESLRFTHSIDSTTASMESALSEFVDAGAASTVL